MNKKIRKMKKDIKRRLNSIEFKRSCKNLKKQFMQEFRTAIYDSSYFNEDENTTNFHPEWGGYKHPTITTVSDCWGETSQLATLNINKLSSQIAYYMSKNTYNEEYYIVECYHEKYGNSWVNF
jgi:hypothetical protein